MEDKIWESHIGPFPVNEYGGRRHRALRQTRITWLTSAGTLQQDEYSILNSKHFIGIHGYMIVYSVASKQSFEMTRIIRDKILNHLVRCSPSTTGFTRSMQLLTRSTIDRARNGYLSSL